MLQSINDNHFPLYFQERSESDKGFVESLLRKIKRLVQFVPVK